MADNKEKPKDVLFAKPESQAFKAHLLQKKRKKRKEAAA